MNTKHKSRNMNLLVLCGMLCRLLENHGTDGWVDKREVFPYLEKLVGKDGLEELEKNIFDCTEDGFCIFDRRDGSRFHLASKEVPLLAPTTDECRMLLRLLERGGGRLFLDRETECLLSDRLEEHLQGKALEPPGALLEKGGSRLADDNPALRENYLLVLEAIRRQAGLSFRYRFDGKWQDVSCFPLSFSFSPLDGRWRILGVDPAGKQASYYLANLKDIGQTEWTGPRKAGQNPYERVEFLIREGRNSLDRVSARFSDCDKEILEDADPEYPYRMTVIYPAWQRRIVRDRLLTLGTGVAVVTEPLRGEIRGMIRDALKNYGSDQQSPAPPGSTRGAGLF